jgi:hypothetical protein
VRLLCQSLCFCFQVVEFVFTTCNVLFLTISFDGVCHVAHVVALLYRRQHFETSAFVQALKNPTVLPQWG